ncbi:MAG: tetratricopeptide repeat protein [Phycisphaerales bacterium]|nr:tetratricopeptide repeat protein [Phycisphaerales bacterium]
MMAIASMAQPAQATESDSWLLRGWGLALAIGILLLAVTVCWWNALDATFVLDDHQRIIHDVDRIDKLWPPQDVLAGSQRPVVRYSLALNHALGGLEPRGYHAVNMILHAMATVLLFLVVRIGADGLRARGAIRLGRLGCLGVAFVVAMIWAVHPLQTAAVTYVIQRAEVLVALFGLLGILALLKSVISPHPGRWLLLMVLACVLAIGSKPTAVFLPALLVAVDAIVLGNGLSGAIRRRGWWYLAAFGVVAVGLELTGALRGLFDDQGGLSGAGAGVQGSGPFEYALLQIGAVGLYLREVFDPSTLSIDHGAQLLESTSLRILGWFAVVGVFILIVYGVWARKWWAILPIWFVLALLPTTSVVPLADPAADHRMYFALAAVVIGVVAIAAFVGQGLCRTPSSRRWGAALAGFMVVIVVFAEGIATIQRNALYKDPGMLWSSVLEQRPDHVRGLVNRAAVSLDLGRFAIAQQDLIRAESIEPGNPNVLLNLARLDIEYERFNDALERTDRVLGAFSENALLFTIRGDALRGLGRPDEALTAYDLAIAKDAQDPVLELVRGNVLSDLGRLEEAAQSYAVSAALARAEGRVASSAFFNLGNTRFLQEQYSEAAASYRRALDAWPGHPSAAEGLAEANRLADG